MDALRFSALRGWSVLMFQLLEWGQSVDLVLKGSLETHRSAMVGYGLHNYTRFQLNVSMFADINECAQNSTICSHVCINTRGDYYCSCFDGYQLIEGTNQCEGIAT